jgi:CPA2 family monovalent cation:H+ antiporter-2
VAVVSIRRAEGQVVVSADALILHVGDTLVLSGRPQDLSRAESLLLKG